jgi:hypothetical protein
MSKSQAKRPTQKNTQQNVGRKVGEIPKKEAKVELYWTSKHPSLFQICYYDDLPLNGGE